jgi:hypothetical protein
VTPLTIVLLAIIGTIVIAAVVAICVLLLLASRNLIVELRAHGKMLELQAKSSGRIFNLMNQAKPIDGEKLIQSNRQLAIAMTELSETILGAQSQTGAVGAQTPTPPYPPPSYVDEVPSHVQGDVIQQTDEDLAKQESLEDARAQGFQIDDEGEMPFLTPDKATGAEA